MIAIVDKPIEIDSIIEHVRDKSAGAIVLFIGSVRDHNDRDRVTGINYEAYKEMAEEMLSKIESEVRGKWPVKFAAVHRIGYMSVGEVSVAVAVSSEHRREAFDACSYAIERIKSIVPIWKKEFSEEGASWVI